MNYWLLKNEPEDFSIDDLANAARQTTHWDGVRNYQARNFIRDDMRKGDLALYYHSNCEVPAAVGIVEVVREAYPDHTAFEGGDPHFDPKSDPDDPRWFMVDVKLQRKLERPIPLKEIKQHAERLEGFHLIQRGNRLSVMPVDPKHWKLILSLENK